MEVNTCSSRGEEDPGCCGCCWKPKGWIKVKLCTYKCWQFLVSTLFSILAFGIAFWGLLGGFSLQDNTFYSNLITFVLGGWLPSPSMKPEKKKQNVRDQEEAKNPQGYEERLFSSKAV